jgi:integrase
MKQISTRYQHGSLKIEQRKNGPAVWVYRWRQAAGRGQTIRRKKILGTTAKIKTHSDAEKKAAALRVDINALSDAPATVMSVGQVVEHFTLVELPNGNRTHRTRETYSSYITNIIVPKWGEYELARVKAVVVERWLAELDGAPSTKAKIRAIMSMLFRHAMRYEFATTNPISLVRQSSKRLIDPVILEVTEVRSLLAELWKQPEPSFTLVFTAVVTGLRRGELFGLKWSDIDFVRKQINIVRSLVNGIVGEPKTSYSRRPIPLTDELAAVLLRWRAITPYVGGDDWVFASPNTMGRQPYWPDSMMYKRIRPAGRAASIEKEFGWHSFRRTTASLLVSGGTSIRTTQEILRHASPTITLGTYAQSVSSERMAAQQTIASLFDGWTQMDPQMDPNRPAETAKLLK